MAEPEILERLLALNLEGQGRRGIYFSTGRIEPAFPISTLQGLPQSVTELPDVAGYQSTVVLVSARLVVIDSFSRDFPYWESSGSMGSPTDIPHIGGAYVSNCWQGSFHCWSVSFSVVKASPFRI